MDKLVAIAFVGFILYVAVRLVARFVAFVTGSRHRAYRNLAARYRGQYENRGFVDPPTVSFRYNGSNVRVGLAPVVAGQPQLPRTRVVARFGQGIPLRLELIPIGRPAPPQPPKGTRLVSSGHVDFDKVFLVRANDPDMAREFLNNRDVRAALDSLRRFAPPHGMLLSVNPERALVQVDRNLGVKAGQLEFAVHNALVLHDVLLACVQARLSVGVDILAAGPATLADTSAPPECEVCGDPILGPHVICESCRTPCHRDCWSFVGGCSTFGCSSKQCRPV